MQTTSGNSVWVGTSNIVLPGNKTTFPVAFQQQSRLSYYASLFNTLEINSSFYKVPMASTFARWSAEAGKPFKFSVKLFRDISHVKELAFSLRDVDAFMKAANSISDETKGCLLIQFPKSTSIAGLDKVAKLLRRVQKNNTGQPWRVCVEFRHTDWYTPAVYQILDENNAALVLHDMPASLIISPVTKAAFSYLRFHGEKGDYRGSYSAELLQDYASKINTWQQDGKEVFVYFNNTLGDAFNNARDLHQLLLAGIKKK